MALTTDRISVLRGRPPVRAGGRRGFRTAHCWLVRSLGYGFGFIPFLRSRPPLLEQTLSESKRVLGNNTNLGIATSQEFPPQPGGPVHCSARPAGFVLANRVFPSGSGRRRGTEGGGERA